MHELQKILLFSSVGIILYAYFIYPATVFLVSVFRAREKGGSVLKPSVSVIITAYNEEKRIRNKMENTIALAYPRDRFQILVASDGSTDGTVAVVDEYKEKGVEKIVLPVRGGKENAQKEALKYATGEIIVFTDVSTMLDPSGVEQIVSNFSDPTIGCASSEDRLVGRDGKLSGEGFYVRYEMWLRRLESKANTPVGLSGSFFAARRSVCKDFSEDMDSDFRTLLNSVRMGMRGICDPKAIGFYQDVSDQRREFERKVRTIVRGLTVFFRNIEFLNVFRYGFFSYQFFCHKLLRWLVPFFLILAFGSNAFLAPSSPIYLLLFAGQILFYGSMILAGFYDVYSSSWKILKIPIYFILVNTSILVAWWRYLRRERMIVWTPSER